jgi:hypothetical protein
MDKVTKDDPMGFGAYELKYLEKGVTKEVQVPLHGKKMN